MINQLRAALTGLAGFGATPAAIGRLCASRPGPAVIDDHGTLSGAELWAAAQRTAAEWQADGRRRHRVGLIGQQDRGFVIGLLAASVLGWDAVGLSPRQPDDRLREAADRLGLTAIAGTEPERVRRIAGDRIALSLTSVPSASGHDLRVSRRPAHRRRGQLIMLTSGTTGTPVAAARRRYGLGLARPVLGLWRTIRPAGGPMMILAPLWHGYGLGMLLLALAGGVPVLLTDRRSSVDRAAITEHHRPRTIVLLPTQLAALIDRWPSRPTSIHRVITGSAPLSPLLCRRALDVLGPLLINLYGSTEAGWATWATPQQLLACPGTIGRPAPGVRVTIVEGQLYVDSPLGTSRQRPTPTADLGHRTADGLLMVDGRLDDTVVVDGNNVSLSVVQQVFDGHRAITWSVVRAEPDPVHGHRLVAQVRTVSGTDPEALRGDLAHKLDWFALPVLNLSGPPERR